MINLRSRAIANTAKKKGDQFWPPGQMKGGSPSQRYLDLIYSHEAACQCI